MTESDLANYLSTINLPRGTIATMQKSVLYKYSMDSKKILEHFSCYCK